MKDITIGGILVVRDASPNEPIDLVQPVAGTSIIIRENNYIFIIYTDGIIIFVLIVLIFQLMVLGKRKKKETSQHLQNHLSTLKEMIKYTNQLNIIIF